MCWLISFGLGGGWGGGQNRSLGYCVWVFFNESWTSGWWGFYSVVISDMAFVSKMLQCCTEFWVEMFC